MGWARSNSNNRGFTLIEVMIAMAILTAVSLGVAQMFAVAINTNLTAKGQTSTAILAAEKMEQLRGLTWGFDTESELGLPLSDTTTDLSTYPPSPTGGRGLNPSPPDTLRGNVQGYCDFLDANGRSLGNGTSPPLHTHYVRRWSIEPLPTNPNNTLILQVLVTTMRREAARTDTTGDRPRLPDDTWLVTVKTRKAP